MKKNASLNHRKGTQQIRHNQRISLAATATTANKQTAGRFRRKIRIRAVCPNGIFTKCWISQRIQVCFCKIAAFTIFGWLDFALLHSRTTIGNKHFFLFISLSLIRKQHLHDSQSERERESKGKSPANKYRNDSDVEKIRKLDNWKGKWLALGTNQKVKNGNEIYYFIVESFVVRFL